MGVGNAVGVDVAVGGDGTAVSVGPGTATVVCARKEKYSGLGLPSALSISIAPFSEAIVNWLAAHTPWALNMANIARK